MILKNDENVNSEGTGATRYCDLALYFAQIPLSTTDNLDRLPSCTVIVVGLGGIGGELIRHLASAGVGSIICIDHDVVDITNLNRQHWFTPSDIGQPKAECLASKLSEFAPTMRVRTIQAFVDTTEHFSSLLHEIYDNELNGTMFIACCADEPVGRIELACIGLASEFSCPVGVSAMNLRRGYWATLTNPEAMEEGRKFFSHVSTVANAIEARPIVGSASWTNCAIAAFFAEDVIRCILHKQSPRLNKLTEFDFDKMSANTLADFQPVSGDRQKS